MAGDIEHQWRSEIYEQLIERTPLMVVLRSDVTAMRLSSGGCELCATFAFYASAPIGRRH